MRCEYVREATNFRHPVRCDEILLWRMAHCLLIRPSAVEVAERFECDEEAARYMDKLALVGGHLREALENVAIVVGTMKGREILIREDWAKSKVNPA